MSQKTESKSKSEIPQNHEVYQMHTNPCETEWYRLALSHFASGKRYSFHWVASSAVCVCVCVGIIRSSNSIGYLHIKIKFTFCLRRKISLLRGPKIAFYILKLFDQVWIHFDRFCASYWNQKNAIFNNIQSIKKNMFVKQSNIIRTTTYDLLKLNDTNLHMKHIITICADFLVSFNRLSVFCALVYFMKKAFWSRHLWAPALNRSSNPEILVSFYLCHVCVLWMCARKYMPHAN